MTQLSRERIEQYAFDDRMCNVNDEIREMARRLLAAEAQKPVAWHVAVPDGKPSFGAMMRALDAFYADEDVPENAMLAAFKILIADMRDQAAQPVAVPDERAAFNKWNNDTDCPLAGLTVKQAAWLAWLKRSGTIKSFGSPEQLEPVSQPYTLPQWIPCSERMPDTDGNYWGWWSESKRQGPVWFIKSALQAQFQSSEITHWMPLPAAPQEPTK